MRRFYQLMFFIGIFGVGCTQSDTSALCVLAYEQIQDEEYESARHTATQCLENADGELKLMYQGYTYRAQAAFRLGEYDAAVSDQWAALELDRSNYVDLVNYSLFLRFSGRGKESLDAIKKAQTLANKKNEPSMMIQYHLGWAYLDDGQLTRAVEEFTKGIPYQPDYPYVYYLRGLAYEGLGNSEAAREDFEMTEILLCKMERAWRKGEGYLEAVSKLRSEGFPVRC